MKQHHFLWDMRPYFRQVVGQLLVGSLAGIVMNIAVVLPVLLLGRAIDTTLAYADGAATAHDVGLAALLLESGKTRTSCSEEAHRDEEQYGRFDPTFCSHYRNPLNLLAFPFLD